MFSVDFYIIMYKYISIRLHIITTAIMTAPDTHDYQSLAPHYYELVLQPSTTYSTEGDSLDWFDQDSYYIEDSVDISDNYSSDEDSQGKPSEDYRCGPFIENLLEQHSCDEILQIHHHCIESINLQQSLLDQLLQKSPDFIVPKNGSTPATVQHLPNMRDVKGLSLHKLAVHNNLLLRFES